MPAKSIFALMVPARWIVCAYALAIAICISAWFPSCATDAVTNQNVSLQSPAHWTTLTPSEYIGQDRKIPFFKLRTENGSVAYLAVINFKDGNYKLVPFFNESTGTTSDAVRRHRAILGINGGYFNLSDGQSTCYVVINGKNQCEPKHNKALIDNPKLKPYLGTIFNRSELRILRNGNGNTRMEVSKHTKPIPPGWLLESSLQAGPELLPELTAQQEVFVRTNPDGTTTDSIGSRRPAARTACGITPDGHVVLLCVASKGQDEFSSGISLEELAQILKLLGCDKAINFDGGTSTTMSVCPGEDSSGQGCEVKQVCGKTPEKLIKSGLLVVRRGKSKPN